jgi:hypothetical protein
MDLVRDLFRRTAPPAEPDVAECLVPVRRGPGGRSAAVAVEEPPPYNFTDARGRRGLL